MTPAELRAGAGYKGKAGDCVVRAIAIATGLPYQKVYDDLFAANRDFAGGRSSAATRVRQKGATPRNGNFKKAYGKYLESLGWEWVPTMAVGKGCTVHLRDDELPRGRIIAQVSKHLTAVIDGVVHDTHDPSRGGQRCVYGYWAAGANRHHGEHEEN